MKMGKITAFITALVAILTTFSFLTPAATANAASAPADFLLAYSSYDSNYVFENLTGKETVDGGKVEVDYANYKYTFSYEPKVDESTLDQAQVEAFLNKKATEEGSTLADLQKEVKEKLSEKDIEVKVDGEKLASSGSKKLTFAYNGDYTATIKRTPKVADSEEYTEKEFAVEFNVGNSGETGEAGLVFKPEYSFDVKVLREYAAQIKEDVKDVDFGDDFTYPDPSDLFTTKFYNKDDVKFTLFYMTPDSSSFSKSTISGSSSKEIELSEHGIYTFYLAMANPVNQDEEIVNLNDYEMKKADDGTIWYYDGEDAKYYLAEENFESVVPEEGEELADITGVTVQYLCDATGNKIYPVFSFSYSGQKTPKIIKSQSEGQIHKAYIGLTYTNASKLLTVESVSNTQTEYRLYFSKTALDDEKLKNTKWEDASKEFKKDGNELYDITDVEDFAFSQSSKNFNAAEAGYYYVTCTVENEFGGDFAYVVIDGTNEITSINYARDWGKDISAFFKNNTTSVIFLGIAILSFIGLMLVIFIKPKEAKVEENVLPKSKD